MTPQELGSQVAMLALEEGRPVGPEVLMVAGAAPTSLSQAAAQASAGNLEQALALLGLEPALRRLAGLWPKAVRAAERRFAQLPRGSAVNATLFASLVYHLLVLTLILAVAGLLQLKVIPVLATIERQNLGGALLEPALLSAWAGACMVSSTALFAGLFAVANVPRLTPWLRKLEGAKAAAAASALLETGAPADVRAAWLREQPALGSLPSEGLHGADLDAVAEQRAEEVRRSVERFALTTRYSSTALLALQATGALVLVYLTTARLASLGPP